TSTVLGMISGIAIKSLSTGYLKSVPRPNTPNARAAMVVVVLSLTAVILIGLFILVRSEVLATKSLLLLFVIVAAVFCVLAWWLFLREALEQFVEVLIWPFYRVRARGPGLAAQPRDGPLIVIANHTAWFDPLWLAKVVDRSVTPMMTSKYYDLPILHWLMVRVAHAIRVQASGFRREVPEIDEATRVLDRRGCLIIFPEGSMKRKAERPLRTFGQGVWRILRERPATPVMVCWIEGGWGSFTSYSGGPPMTKKPIDWRRPINIAMEAPLVLDKELLAEQRETRTFLMEKCLQARRLLDLEPYEIKQIVEEESDESESI